MRGNELWGPVPPELSDLEYLNYARYGTLHETFGDSPCTSPTVVDQSLKALVADCEALWDFYESQDLGIWEDIDWIARSRTTPIEHWDRVTVAEGRITGLELGLERGYKLSPQLGALTGLRQLSSCTVYGPIPPELGNLTELEELDFRSSKACLNQLTGSIPPELGNLTELRWLGLGFNRLTGPIPAELGNLTNSSSWASATMNSPDRYPPNSASSPTSKGWT